VNPTTIDLPSLCVRADVGTVNEEARTVDLIFSTGASVDRMDYWSGKRYREVLSMDPAHIRLDRINAGGPLLDSHSAWSVGDILGTVVPGSARVEKGKGLATVRFSKRDTVEPIWQDVRDGIIRSVSVGYRVHKFEEDSTKKDAIPVRTAIDWEPYEISMVPMPADTGARVRTGDKSDTNPCVIVTRNAQESAAMEKETQPQPAAEQPNLDAVRTEAIAAERARVQGITTAVRTARLEDSFAQELIAGGKTLDEARAAIFTKMAETEEQTETRNTVVTFGEDARDKWIRGAGIWLLQRSGFARMVAKHEGSTDATANPGEFRGLSLLDLAKETLERHNVSTRGLSRMEIAGRAMAFRSGGNYQTASDFAVLLENTLHKILRAAYAVTPDTWSRICGTASVTDFRTHNWYRTGALTVLEDLNEHGEFKSKTIPDAEKATYSVGTKGNVIGITREVIVNDDLGFVTRLTEMLGRSGKLTIEKAFYALLAQNSGLGPSQSDSQPLFHSNRSNVGSAAAISMSALDADAAVMAVQTDVNGQDILDLRPSVLLVPRTLEGNAKAINGAEYDPDTTGKLQKPNIVKGLFNDVVGTGRLSGTRRYLFADPSVAPVFVVSFLEGQQEPVIETQDGWRYNGVELKARLDVGVAAVDFRGAVTNAGA
jgi:hypothetical protein